MTAKSCCARLLDARDGERYFLHFFHVTVFTQPRSKGEELNLSITGPLITQQTRAGAANCSLHDLVGAGEQRRWDCKAKCLRGLEIDHELETRWLLYRQVGWLLALQN